MKSYRWSIRLVTVLMALFGLSSSAWAANQCLNYCGQQAPTGCSCAYGCLVQGTCCADYKITCLPNYKLWNKITPDQWGTTDYGAGYTIESAASAANYGYGKLGSSDNVTAWHNGTAFVKLFGEKTDIVNVKLSRQVYGNGTKNSIKSMVTFSGNITTYNSDFSYSKTLPIINVWQKSKTINISGINVKLTIKVGGSLVVNNSGSVGNVFGDSGFSAGQDFGLKATPSFSVNLGVSGSSTATASGVSAGLTSTLNFIELAAPATLLVAQDRNSTGTQKTAKYSANTARTVKKLVGKLTVNAKVYTGVMWVTLWTKELASFVSSATNSPLWVASGSVNLNDINALQPITDP